MRAHHWLFLLAILLIVGGFVAFSVAVVALKFILWGIGLLLLIGAIGSMRGRRAG